MPQNSALRLAMFSCVRNFVWSATSFHSTAQRPPARQAAPVLLHDVEDALSDRIGDRSVWCVSASAARWICPHRYCALRVTVTAPSLLAATVHCSWSVVLADLTNQVQSFWSELFNGKAYSPDFLSNLSNLTDVQQKLKIPETGTKP